MARRRSCGKSWPRYLRWNHEETSCSVGILVIIVATSLICACAAAIGMELTGTDGNHEEI